MLRVPLGVYTEQTGGAFISAFSQDERSYVCKKLICSGRLSV